MKNRVSINDLATAVNLSRTAVSFALNGREGIGESTRKQILETAKSIGYIQKKQENRTGPRVGSSMPRKKKRMKRILFATHTRTDMTQPVYMDIFEGMRSAAFEMGCDLVFRRYTQGRLETSDAHGVLFMGNPVPAFSSEMPVVLLTNAVHKKYDRVTYDNDRIGPLAAEYLLECGCKRLAVFAFYQGQISDIFVARFNTFAETARAGGAEVDIFTTPDMPSIEKEFGPAFQGKWKYDGIFSAADMLTVRLNMLFSGKGVVPEKDFKLVSCNNERPHVSTFSPIPAEIDIHAQLVGKRGLELLLNRIDNPASGQETVYITPDLILPNHQ